MIVKAATLRFDGGVCSDVVMPGSALQVNATSAGLYQASGATWRAVSALGVFSGTIEISFDFALETSSYTHLAACGVGDVAYACR